MSDLGNRANVNSAIDLLLDDTQPNEAIQPSDHNTLLKNILDTLSNGLSVTLRTNPETSGQDIELTAGDKLKFKDSGFVSSLLTATLTADRTLTLPDATGTIALIGDVFTAGSGITENAGQIDLGGTLTIDAIINGAGNRTLKLGTNVLNENLSILEKNSIQAFERYANSFPFLNSGLEIIKNPGNFIGNLKSSATDYVQFRLTSDEFLVNSILGTNILAHQSSSTLSQTIVSDTSGGTSSRLELYGSGRVNLGTNGSVGASIVLDSVNTFTDRNTTAKGLEYALDYSANYTDRSLVDKAFVLANAGGDSIYTADGSLTGNRTVDLDGNNLSFNNTNGVNSLLNLSDNAFGKISNTIGGLFLDWNGVSRLYLGNGIINNKTGNFTVSNYNGTQTSLNISTNALGNLTINNSVGSVFKWGSSEIQMAGSFTKISRNGTTKIHLNNNSTIIGSGATSPIGSEDISLQGSTVIKGLGTSGSSALAIYDNDTTPTKVFDFLDNGNVNLGVDSVVGIGANDLDINGTGLFSVSNGAKSISTSWNTHTTFNLDNGSGTTYSLYNGNASSTFNAGEFGIGVGSNIPFRIFNTSSVALGSVPKGSLDNNYNVQTAGATLIGGSLDTKLGTNEISLDHNNYPKLKISNGTNEYWLIEGDGTGSTFDTGDLYLYDQTNSQKILQFKQSNDSLLFSVNLDMNNNRILNTVVNPSVQETTSTATFTINSDQQTDAVLTAMAVATTIAIPTGTPVQSQNLIFRFKDNGTARAITWNAIFRAIGITLPTTTTASKLLYVGCKYNSTDTKWDVIAIKEEV